MTSLPTLPGGYRLSAFETLDSTNAELKRRVQSGGAEHLDVMWTLEQTGGRGRRGRKWSGPPGNLMCSIFLRPECGLATAAQLSFVAALAVHETVSAFLPDDRAVAVKWPNDVLVDGRKISGILLEAGGWMPGAPGWIVVGTGVNLRHHPSDTEWPSTDIAAAGGTAPTPSEALEKFCAAFERWRARWADGGFEPVRAGWLKRAHGLGGAIVARMDRCSMEGRFLGIDPDGSLVLGLESGEEHRISAADVFPAAR